jgi:hypothetical protein
LAVPHPGQKPPPPGGQHRQIQRVRVEPAQVGQLAQLDFHRCRAGGGRPRVQPPQRGTPQVRVDHQQPVQLGPPQPADAIFSDQRCQQQPGLGPGPLAGSGDVLQQQYHARAHHLFRAQVLTRQPEQQLRRVVFHRPGEQELIEFLPPRRIQHPPARVGHELPQMPGAGLPPLPIGRQLRRRDAQPVSQPGHRRRRGCGHIVGNEPQPRQGAQLHARPQHVAPAMELSHERLIGAGQREIPDQLRAGDLRETPQPRQLPGGEHIARRHGRADRLRPVLDRPAGPHSPARDPHRSRRVRGPDLPRQGTHRHQPGPARPGPGAGRRPRRGHPGRPQARPARPLRPRRPRHRRHPGRPRRPPVAGRGHLRPPPTRCRRCSSTCWPCSPSSRPAC